MTALTNIFPSTLSGLDWSVMKTPISSTRALTARSGLEYRAANWSYGKYKWQLAYTILRNNIETFQELQTIMSFCLQMQGMYQAFLYSDPSDNSITGQVLGTGNGTQTVFPLVRAFSGYGGYVEPNLVLNTLSNVYLGGVAQSTGFAAYQNGQYGLDSIQFSSAPGSGIAVSADFSWYFPVRFLQDEFEFNNFAYGFWELKKLAFQSVK
jgi:uncharacterized protein (TIGR02217 family)